MDIKDIHTFLQGHLTGVETLIETSLRSDIGLLDQANRSLREHPGKMLRPMLALLVAGALGKVNDSTLRYAAATELLHNATLLHDDVVDGAQLRRGVPTVARLLGPEAAVLMGDFWLVRCLDLVLSGKEQPDRVLRLFSATLSHLTEGELLQMERTKDGATTQEDYLRIIYGKTASLFVTAALSGAISVGASEQLCAKAEDFARFLGTAFQLRDDILDYVGEALGKPSGADLKEQKITQPLLCALEKSPQEAAAVRSMVACLAGQPELEQKVREFVMEQDGPSLAVEVMNGYIGKALTCLEAFPEGPEKDYLEALTRFVGDRLF